MKFIINIDDLLFTYNEINNYINDLNTNGRIILEFKDEYYKYEDFNENILTKYKSFLYLLVELICDKYKNSNIFVQVDVLTDIFFLTNDDNKINSNYLLCLYCPCLQCNPNSNLFKNYTNNEYLPFNEYCNKSFIEKEISIFLLNKLKDINFNLISDFELVDISDITIKDLYYISGIINGNSIEKQLC